MKSVKAFNKIYFYRPFVDFRKGVRSLSALIQDQMGLNPFEAIIVIFTSKSRDRVKIVYWDRNGFSMWYKILEKEKFFWPSDDSRDNILVNRVVLQRFLRGLNPWQRSHRKLFYKKV